MGVFIWYERKTKCVSSCLPVHLCKHELMLCICCSQSFMSFTQKYLFFVLLAKGPDLLETSERFVICAHHQKGNERKNEFIK